MVIQVALLTAAAIVICLAGRLYGKNRFSMEMLLPYQANSLETSDLSIEWEDGEIPVEEYTLDRITDDQFHASVLNITMKPEKPGKHIMKVMTPDGELLLMDVIHVGHFRTAFSGTNGSFTADEPVMLSLILFYLGLALIMIRLFVKLKGPLAYSYESILACGVFLFALVALVIEIPVFIRHLISPVFYPTWQLLNDIAAGGKNFVFLTFPLLAVFCILLIISNIELLRHERPRIQNYLGLLLGILLLGGGALILYLKTGFFQGSYEEYRIRITIENVLGIAFTYVECILFSSMICGLRAARHIPEYDRDYILILGCGFRKDGTLPPLLRGRVDKAMEFWYRQKEKTGKEAVVIPSGGQGSNECMPEAEAMSRYMISTGFPENALIREDRSANTYQNMEFSKKIIEAEENDLSKVKTAFVTTNYHVFRSGVWAGLAGLKAEGLGSRTKWWFWPNAFVRECAGLLRNRLVPEIIGLVFLLIVFGSITMIMYM